MPIRIYQRMRSIIYPRATFIITSSSSALKADWLRRCDVSGIERDH